MSLEVVTTLNKFAKSNLGRGPRCSAVAHIRRKIPIAPQIRPQKYPCPWADCQTPIPASSLDPSDLYDAKRHPDPIRRFAIMHWTDRQTDGQTDRQMLTGKFDDYRPLRYESDAA